MAVLFEKTIEYPPTRLDGDEVNRDPISRAWKRKTEGYLFFYDVGKNGREFFVRESAKVISHANDDVSLSFDYYTMSGELKHCEVRTERKKAKTIRHEFCLMILGFQEEPFQSDVKLWRIGRLQDTADYTTIDFYDRETNVALEFKAYERISDEWAENARELYREDIQRRGAHSNLLMISENRVVTSFGTFEEMSHCSSIFESGYILENELSMKGLLMYDKIEDKLLNEYYFENSMSKKLITPFRINDEPYDPIYFIDKQYIRKCKTLTMTNYEELTKNCMKIADAKRDKDVEIKKNKGEMINLIDKAEQKIRKTISKWESGINTNNNQNFVNHVIGVFEEVNEPSMPGNYTEEPNLMRNLWASALSQHEEIPGNEEPSEAEIKQIDERGYVGEYYDSVESEKKLDEIIRKFTQTIRKDGSMPKEEKDRIVARTRLINSKKFNEKKIIRKTRLEESEKTLLELQDDVKKVNRNDNSVVLADSILQAENISQENSRRKKNSRVHLRVTDEAQQLELASRGVRSKRKENDQHIKDEDQRRKQIFSLDVNTTDIDNYIADDEIHRINFVRTHLTKMEYLDEMFDKKSEENMVNAYKSFFSSDFGRIAEFVSRVQEELNLNFSTPLSGDNYLIRRIRKTDVFILMRPTGVDNILTYSILMPEINARGHGNIFPKWHRYNDNWVYSEFRSISETRTSHLLFMGELMFSLREYLLELTKDAKKTAEYLNLMLLFCLVNTKAVTENMLLWRYLYMKLACDNFTYNHMDEVILKMNDKPRNRFEVWIINKTIDMTKKMIILPPKPSRYEKKDDEENAVSLEYYENIVGPTGNKVETFSEVLFLAYMGTWANKNEGDKTQGLYKILTKIAKLERKLHTVTRKNHIGTDDVLEGVPKDHEFSPTWVAKGGRIVRRMLMKKYGKMETFIKRKIVTLLDKRRMDIYATTKASSKRTEKKTLSDPVDEKEFGKTYKCMEAFLKLLRGLKPHSTGPYSFLNFSDMMEQLEKSPEFQELNEQAASNLRDDYGNLLPQVEEYRQKIQEQLDENIREMIKSKPMQNINQMIEYLNTHGGIQTILFKKQQLTGPREIFILDPISRLVISFLETTSRAVAEELDIETLTNGKGKYKISEMHYKKMAEMKRQQGYTEDVTGIDSDDKTQWCQQFMMRMFGCMYANIFSGDSKEEKRLLKTLCNILNLVTMKNIQVPMEMILDFAKRAHVKSYEDETEAMKDDFLKRGPNWHKLMYENGMWLINISNMMQGILHYTSTVAASCNNYAIKEECERITAEMLLHSCAQPGHPLYKVNVMYMEECWKNSSDDSSTIRTFLIKWDAKDTEERRSRAIAFLKMWITKLSYYGRELARHFEMVYSVAKSTSPDFSYKEEYNSLWTVANCTVSVPVKFMYPAMKMAGVQSLEDRMRYWFESRKSVIENGGSFRLLNALQISQFMVHFGCLGMNTSKFFKIYWELIGKFRLPNFGGFLKADFRCPIMGFDYEMAMLITKEAFPLLVFTFLYEQNHMELDEYGKPSIKFAANIGSRRKYNDFIRRISPPSDLNTYYQMYPDILCREPNSDMDVWFSILKKVKDPACALSFNFLDMNKVHKTAAYILQTAALTIKVKEKEKVDEDTESREQKLGRWMMTHSSLIGAMKEIDSILKVGEDVWREWVAGNGLISKKTKNKEENTFKKVKQHELVTEEEKATIKAVITADEEKVVYRNEGARHRALNQKIHSAIRRLRDDKLKRIVKEEKERQKKTSSTVNTRLYLDSITKLNENNLLKMSETMKTIFFPKLSFYREARRIIKESGNWIAVSLPKKLAKRRCYLTMPVNDDGVVLSLRDFLAVYWFGDKSIYPLVKVPKSYNAHRYRTAKEVYLFKYEWIRPDFYSTIEDSNNMPFSSISSLFDFIKSLDVKESKLSPISSAMRTTDNVRLLRSLIRHCRDHNHIYYSKGKQETHNQFFKKISAMSVEALGEDRIHDDIKELNLISSCALASGNYENFKDILGSCTSLYVDPIMEKCIEAPALSGKECEMILLKRYCDKGRISLKEYEFFQRKLSRSLIVNWYIPQSFDPLRGHYYGDGVIKVSERSLTVLIYVTDNTMTKVVSNSEEIDSLTSVKVERFLKKAKITTLKPITDDPRPGAEGRKGINMHFKKSNNVEEKRCRFTYDNEMTDIDEGDPNTFLKLHSICSYKRYFKLQTEIRGVRFSICAYRWNEPIRTHYRINLEFRKETSGYEFFQGEYYSTPINAPVLVSKTMSKACKALTLKPAEKMSLNLLEALKMKDKVSEAEVRFILNCMRASSGLSEKVDIDSMVTEMKDMNINLRALMTESLSKRLEDLGKAYREVRDKSEEDFFIGAIEMREKIVRALRALDDNETIQEEGSYSGDEEQVEESEDSVEKEVKRMLKEENKHLFEEEDTSEEESLDEDEKLQIFREEEMENLNFIFESNMSTRDELIEQMRDLLEYVKDEEDQIDSVNDIGIRERGLDFVWNIFEYVKERKVLESDLETIDRILSSEWLDEDEDIVREIREKSNNYFKTERFRENLYNRTFETAESIFKENWINNVLTEDIPALSNAFLVLETELWEDQENKEEAKNFMDVLSEMMEEARKFDNWYGDGAEVDDSKFTFGLEGLLDLEEIQLIEHIRLDANKYEEMKVIRTYVGKKIYDWLNVSNFDSMSENDKIIFLSMLGMDETFVDMV